MREIIRKLLNLLQKEEKKILFGLFVFSLFISLIEAVGVSVIMPFIAVATNFDLIHTNGYYSYIYGLFGFDNDTTFIFVFGMILVLFYIFRSLLNLLYVYLLSTFTEGRYSILASRLFKNYMGLPYQSFIGLNSSILTKTLITEALYLTTLLSSTLLLISEVFVIILLYAIMFYVSFSITIALTIFLSLNALLMLKTVSKEIKKVGAERAELQNIFFEMINRSFANFKLIKLHVNNENIQKEFNNISSKFAKSNITNTTLSQIPRFFLEAIGFSVVIIIIMFFVWKSKNDISNSLAILSMYVLALYRLMPSVNKVLTNFNLIVFHYRALDIIYDDLMRTNENLGKEKIFFNKEIRVSNVSFYYRENKYVLKDIDLTIKKGSKIAFIGESGSGKSTLVDIIIGLFEPSNGAINIDGVQLNNSNIVSWRNKVGYIPQNVYLFDGTVGENIAFGLKYDETKLISVLKKTKMHDFINSKEGLSTLVGEGGIMLSGGQKQRIAIARALYSEPEVLILDEATSALDDATEQEIMDEIYTVSENKTLIIIAHRLSTIDRCEEIYKINSCTIEQM